MNCTGFPQPKPTNSIIIVPAGSRCASGFSVTRPWRRRQRVAERSRHEGVAGLVEADADEQREEHGTEQHEEQRRVCVHQPEDLDDQAVGDPVRNKWFRISACGLRLAAAETRTFTRHLVLRFPQPVATHHRCRAIYDHSEGGDRMTRKDDDFDGIDINGPWGGVRIGGRFGSDEWGDDDADVRRIRRRVRQRLDFYKNLAIFAVVVGGLALADGLTGGGWWVQWVAAIWGFFLILQFGAAFVAPTIWGRDAEERMVRREVERQRGRVHVAQPSATESHPDRTPVDPIS